MKSAMITLVAVTSLVACQRQSDEILRVSEAPQKQRIESVLMRVLDESGGSGSLAYRGTCGSSGGVSDSFHLDAPSREAIRPVEAWRDILNRNQSLVVKEDPDGLLRIVSKDVSRDFLDFRIDASFAGETDPNDALWRALSKAQLGTFDRDHHFAIVPTLGGLRAEVTASSPRMRGQLKGVTVAATLDYILHVFPGMWVYQECVTDDGDTKASVWFIQSFHQDFRKQH